MASEKFIAPQPTTNAPSALGAYTPQEDTLNAEGRAIREILNRGRLTLSQIAQAAPLVGSATHQTLDHLPRHWEELLSLSDEQKILLAAAAASGGDAVAYYTPDTQGAYALASHIDLYPDRHTRFEPALPAYDPATFHDEAAVSAHAFYQLPVRTADGAIKGIIAIHASPEYYDQQQPLSCRKAKLTMAAHIVSEHQDLFGATREVLMAREAHHKSLPQKLKFFQQLANDMKATYAHDDFQLDHIGGVMRLMDLAMEKAVNARQPILNADQQQLIHELAFLHDIGKTQLASQFLTPWGHQSEPEHPEKKTYGIGHNNNHPLFSLLTLLMYPTDALTTAAHHHGLFRYSDDALKSLLGPAFERYHILEDNIPDSALPMLSRILRVCDVAEAMTARGNQTVDSALYKLAAAAGYDAKSHQFKPQPATPDSISAECLCFLIANGVFDAYGQEQAAAKNGWVDKHGTPKYDAEKIASAKREILEAYGWEQKKAATEAYLRTAIQSDGLIVENPGRNRTLSR